MLSSQEDADNTGADEGNIEWKETHISYVKIHCGTQ